MSRLQSLFHAFVALAVTTSLTACSASPLAGPPAERAVAPVHDSIATRTVVAFGPGDVMVTEVLRVGADAHAVTRTLAGPFGQEILVGDDHYVRFDVVGPALGFDKWIHTDLSDPAQREYARRNPAGLIDTADLVDTPVGGRIGRWEVLAVERVCPGRVVLDLDDGSVFSFTTEVLAETVVIEPPDAGDVVDLVDLPDHLDLPTFNPS